MRLLQGTDWNLTLYMFLIVGEVQRAATQTFQKESPPSENRARIVLAVTPKAAPLLQDLVMGFKITL